MAPITDEVYMRRALALAEMGWGQVHPNPLVGAVVVADGGIVGQGWHAGFGEAHAERVALDQAGAAARGATLYLTLEPCAHHGQTPPCVEAIISAGIRRVVVADRDPNPIAAGGIARLTAVGIEVALGVRAEQSRRLNARFLHLYADSTRPFIAIKLAVTMDGFIADKNGNSRWISGPQARDWVHRERAGYAGIGVGASTAIHDDVRLTVRGAVTPRLPPSRVVFDRSGLLPTDHGIFTDAAGVPVILVRGSAAPLMDDREGVSIIRADTLAAALEALLRHGIDSILIEGGGRLAGELLATGLVDRVYQVQAPTWLGAGTPAWAGLAAAPLADALRWRTVARKRLGNDTLLTLEH